MCSSPLPFLPQQTPGFRNRNHFPNSGPSRPPIGIPSSPSQLWFLYFALCSQRAPSKQTHSFIPLMFIDLLSLYSVSGTTVGLGWEETPGVAGRPLGQDRSDLGGCCGDTVTLWAPQDTPLETQTSQPGVLSWDPGAPAGQCGNLRIMRPSVARILASQNHRISGA